MNMYKNSLLARSEATHTPVHALDVWSASLHPGTKPRPLHKITCRLLSICPNSASCERLFSVFGGISTQWRNRLSMENLTRLAELKLYVHKEHVRDDAVKKRLKCKHADIIEEKLVWGDASSCSGGEVTVAATSNQQEEQEPEYSAVEMSTAMSQYS
ncbi:hypothetical protein BS17DRAFT_810809 [Gyrodon lividus]|nr:hypothetical protein BS17DRAFT_810809 [Gyrodon lividus]